jgi:hypothetical protein
VAKDNQAYFAERAAEELAAANSATSADAARAHRELSLRYSLKLILPEPAVLPDDTRPIGQPKRAQLAAQRQRPRPRTRRRRA